MLKTHGAVNIEGRYKPRTDAAKLLLNTLADITRHAVSFNLGVSVVKYTDFITVCRLLQRSKKSVHFSCSTTTYIQRIARLTGQAAPFRKTGLACALSVMFDAIVNVSCIYRTDNFFDVFLNLFFGNPDALEGQETPIDAHPFDAVFRY